jgi:hypothetical protein
MVIAAAAVIAFGALGILAITDRAPSVTFPPNPIRAASPQHVVVTTGEAKSEVMGRASDPLRAPR